MNRFVAGIVAGCAIAFAGQTLAQETLTVWWAKGFYKSEDDALLAAIKKFEDKTKIKVELSQYPVQDMIPKTVSRVCRRVRLPGYRQMGVRRQARGLDRDSHADEGELPAQYC